MFRGGGDAQQAFRGLAVRQPFDRLLRGLVRGDSAPASAGSFSHEGKGTKSSPKPTVLESLFSGRHFGDLLLRHAVRYAVFLSRIDFPRARLPAAPVPMEAAACASFGVALGSPERGAGSREAAD